MDFFFFPLLSLPCTHCAFSENVLNPFMYVTSILFFTLGALIPKVLYTLSLI